MYQKRYPVLRKAVSQFLESPPEDFDNYCQKNDFWLTDFALFMALKDVHGGAPWSKWKEPLRNRDENALKRAAEENEENIVFWKVLQYLFFRQWNELKTYANERGISIIGDLPIYVSLDSVDVWAHPELFQLNEDKIPKEVAGCPPDGFSADGQLWGNPLFDWGYMEEHGFSWWIERIRYLCNVYDTLRIDHFRGFDAYYAIPYGDTTAQNGYWKQGPGMKLFNAVERAIGRQPIIAEDLGHLTDSVRQLLKDSGFPGMKVMEFAFDSRDESGNEYLPHNYIENCVAYAGTHDNDTILGWFAEADSEDTDYAKKYLKISEDDLLNWSMMDVLWESVANMVIIQAQDILDLGSEARMNQPSTVGTNWQWRALPGVFTQELACRLKEKMEIYNRLG
jgi:4-alpha-glucanotransferase